MTQKRETEVGFAPSKEEILEKVTEIFFDTIPFIERHELSAGMDIDELKICHEDISFFLTDVFKYFNISIYAPYDSLFTLRGISDFIFGYLSSGRQDEDPRDKQGLWGKFLKWLNP
jgi:hypothetical protein